MPDSFIIHHLRFTAQVETTIELDAFKGSALRGAWQSHLRTLYCAQRDNQDPLHQAMCPVCFLLSRETGSGEDRRPYAFMPPLTRQTRFEPGERFSFGISLFGQTVQFLPYLVLAVGQMGQAQGLGRPTSPVLSQREGESAKAQGPTPPPPPPRFGEGRTPPSLRGKGAGGLGPRPRRGTFRLVSIEETNPLTGQTRTLLEEGGTTVHMPTLPVTRQQVEAAAGQMLESLAARGGQVTVDFLTPTRIVHREKLVHQPRFSPFFARLLDRVAALRTQFADEPPLPAGEKARLLSLADRVALQLDETQWWDVHGRSTRLGREQPLGGFVGRAVYQAGEAGVWRPLLPWLLWGQSTQVGKNVVKGCGWYEVGVNEEASQRVSESSRK